MSRRRLTDEQWGRIEPTTWASQDAWAQRGRQSAVRGRALWTAGNTARWRDLPEVFGKWTAAHARFRRWSHAGVWERLFHALADTPDFEFALIDSTISKVHADATGAKGRLKLPRSVARAAA